MSEETRRRFPSGPDATLRVAMFTPREPGQTPPGANHVAAALRGRLARVENGREQIAKAWLADLILNSPLSEAEGMPVSWVTEDLPELISDILAAVGEGGSPPHLTRRGAERAQHLASARSQASAGQLSRELSYLHENLVGALGREMIPAEPELFAEAATRLAAVFGLVGGAAADSLFEHAESGHDPVTGLGRPAEMRRRLDQLIATGHRYGHPFSIVLFDAEGPGAQEAGGDVGKEGVLQIVASSLRESIRLIDEGFRLEEDELCVLAPHQTSDEAVRMADRLSELLGQVERAGGLEITVSAGVVSCPEHGNEAEELLRRADTAMWRARATGQRVAVGGVQDRSQVP